MQSNQKIFIDEDQYLNYLILELLNLLGVERPIQEQIKQAEMLMTDYCSYLNYLATWFLKLAQNDHPTKKQINHTKSLIIKCYKKYQNGKYGNVVAYNKKTGFLRMRSTKKY